jgi:hypothetical protein
MQSGDLMFDVGAGRREWFGHKCLEALANGCLCDASSKALFVDPFMKKGGAAPRRLALLCFARLLSGLGPCPRGDRECDKDAVEQVRIKARWRSGFPCFLFVPCSVAAAAGAVLSA